MTLLPLAAYRAAWERVVEMIEAGPEADPHEAAVALEEVRGLADIIGEPEATNQRRRWQYARWQITGRCPLCGELGEYHGETA